LKKVRSYEKDNSSLTAGDVAGRGYGNIEVRNTNGGEFDQKVFVAIDKKIVIEPVFTQG